MTRPRMRVARGGWSLPPGGRVAAAGPGAMTPPRTSAAQGAWHPSLEAGRRAADSPPSTRGSVSAASVGWVSTKTQTLCVLFHLQSGGRLSRVI